MTLALSIINTVLASIIILALGMVLFTNLDKKSHKIICIFGIASQVISIITTWALYSLI